MQLSADQVLEAVLALPQDDQIKVFTRLQESVGHFVELEVAREWEEEIARRLKELDEGEVESIPAEEVYREIQQKYGISFD